jgi:glycosyltransferase involved in cell wall biosynthesis
MRLLFVARAMHDMAGGVERMIVAIMNEMVRRGHDVGLFSWDRDDARAFYPMDPAISWYKLHSGDPSAKAGLLARLERISKIRKVVTEFRPDVITCFQGGPFRAMLGYTLGLGVPLVAAERTAPTLYDHVKHSNTKTLEHLVFRQATRITVQFDRYRQYYPPALQKLIVETPNPVTAPARTAMPADPGQDGRFTLLSVGRLSYQKNYDVLLEAFSLVAQTFPDWDLKIVGEGENRAHLQDMIDGSGVLHGRVSMPGTTSDVGAGYAGANLFCLPSRWEGFPNALAEALAHGLPSVGFEECAGVPDLIEAGVSGLLATGNNSARSLADALSALMPAHALRSEMGIRAQRSMERYLPSVCFDRWEAVLREACAR